MFFAAHCMFESLYLLLFERRTPVDHFTVVCFVAWPLNEGEAGGDLALIETFLLFLR